MRALGAGLLLRWSLYGYDSHKVLDHIHRDVVTVLAAHGSKYQMAKAPEPENVQDMEAFVQKKWDCSVEAILSNIQQQCEFNLALYKDKIKCSMEWLRYGLANALRRYAGCPNIEVTFNRAIQDLHSVVSRNETCFYKEKATVIKVLISPDDGEYIIEANNREVMDAENALIQALDRIVDRSRRATITIIPDAERKVFFRREAEFAEIPIKVNENLFIRDAFKRSDFVSRYGGAKFKSEEHRDAVKARFDGWEAKKAAEKSRLKIEKVCEFNLSTKIKPYRFDLQYMKTHGQFHKAVA